MKKKICALMAIVLCMMSVCSVNVESTFAAEKLTKSQKQNYKKAIEKFVEDEMITGDEKKNVYFSFYDIDKDGKKEMMIDNNNNAHGSGCVIDHNGKLMTVESYDGNGKLGKRDFYYRSLTIYKKGVVRHSGVGPAGGYITWYKADVNGKLKEIASWSIEMDGDHDIYTVKGKKVSEKTYNNYIKNFSEVSNIKRYSYTKKNIENYLSEQKVDWKTAYREFFDKKTVSWGDRTELLSKLKFAFIDIDQNGIPELVLQNKGSGMVYGFEHVYGYRNGKIVRMIDESYGNAITYHKKNKMICSAGGKMDLFYEYYYVIKENRAVCIASREIVEEYDNEKGGFNTKITYYNKRSWENNAKKISKKQFESIVKQGWNLDNINEYKKGFEFKEVTKNNLSKYLN